MSMDNSMMVFFLSMLATYSIVGFVWWLLHVVAAWRIFTKAGEAGWKSIIPIYSTYITYKISWKKKNLFWATLAATVLAFVLSPFSIQITYKRQKAAAGTPAAAFWFYSSVSMGA